MSAKLKFLLPLLLCLIIFPAHTMIKTGFQAPVYDARGYIHQSEELKVFPKEIEAGNTIIFPPFYPGFLKFFSSNNSDLKEALNCYKLDGNNCNIKELWPIYTAQMLMLAVGIYLIFLGLYFLTGQYGLSLFAMILVLGFGKLNVYGTWLITEAMVFTFFFAFMAAYCYILTRDAKIWHYMLMGVAIAGAALTRPSYMYLIYALVPFLPFYMVAVRKLRPRDAIKNTAAFILSICIIIGPWILRNYYYYDFASVSVGYGSYILSERVAYNEMTWTEWAVSFIYWLPDFGDKLASALFSEEFYQRLNFESPTGFYLIGNTEFRNEIYSLASTEAERRAILLNDYIFQDLFKHIMVTFTMVCRGMWTGKYFGLVGFVFLVPGILILRHRVRFATLCAFAVPFYFMLGLNAFVSVSIPRYNMPMQMFYALFIAAVFYYAVSKKWRQSLTSGTQDH
ncbi:hypothetical protein [Terasakiella pusilla]|uniref:hypothetical protein n=1 Tax=Terasakiella pusilla TaxID=64973 RepID=UPI003AA891DA